MARSPVTKTSVRTRTTKCSIRSICARSSKLATPALFKLTHYPTVRPLDSRQPLAISSPRGGHHNSGAQAARCPMPLILKPALPLSGGLKNYFVHAGSLTIGRIFQTEMSGNVVRWHWGSINRPNVCGVVDHGLVASASVAPAALGRHLQSSNGTRTTDPESPSEVSGCCCSCRAHLILYGIT